MKIKNKVFMIWGIYFTISYARELLSPHSPMREIIASIGLFIGIASVIFNIDNNVEIVNNIIYK